MDFARLRLAARAFGACGGASVAGGVGRFVGTQDAVGVVTVAEGEADDGGERGAEAAGGFEDVERGVAAGERGGGGGAGGRDAQGGTQTVAGVLGHQPVGGQLAAREAVQAGRPVGRAVVDHGVVARQVALAHAEAVERGPHAPDGVGHAMRVDPGQRALHRLEHVGDLVLGHLHPVEVAVEVVVGGSRHAVLLVREGEHVAPVDAARVDRQVRDAPLEHQMDALAGAQLDASPGSLRHDRRPGAGRVQREVGLDLERLAAQPVAHTSAQHATAGLAQEVLDLGVRHHHGAAGGRVERVDRAQARGVHAPLVEREGALGPRRQRGLEPPRLLGREPRVRPPVLEGLVAVVHLEPDLDQLGTDRILGKDRHQERDAEHQVRRDALDHPRVDARVERHLGVLLQVAKPAVEHARRGPRGAGAELALLDQRAAHPAQRQVAGDAGAVDPAAHHQHLHRDAAGHCVPCACASLRTASRSAGSIRGMASFWPG